MKLSEKLQKIRKENNITQEGLADRLNVSRQAVSKWESGMAYPDTEKLIQISKIFKVSLDELINDDIDSNKSNVNKKINFMEILNNGIDFISKSVNMFWSMKFTEKIKCLFEMILLILIILGISLLSTSIMVDIVRRIFVFLPYDFVYHIGSLFETLLFLAWLILGIIIVIKIFKTRYLDYYVIINDDSVSEKVIEEPIRELREKREYKIVIRDPKDSSFNFFKKIGKIFSFIVKLFGVVLMVPLVIFFILAILILVFSLFYIVNGLFFLGISIAIIGVITFVYLMIEFIYNLLFNREHAVRRIFIIFIFSISMIGVGLGFSFVSLTDFTYEKNVVTDINTHTIKMSDDLVLMNLMYSYDSDGIIKFYDDNIIIDNSLDDIKIEITSYGYRDVYLYSYNSYGNINNYRIIDLNESYDEIERYRIMFNNLKNRKIVSYDMIYEDKIYISYDNLMRVRNNFLKYNGLL